MKLTKEQSEMLEKNNLHLNAKEKGILESLVSTNGKLNGEILDNVGGGKINIPPVVYKAATILGYVGLGVVGTLTAQEAIKKYGSRQQSGSAGAPGAPAPGAPAPGAADVD